MWEPNAGLRLLEAQRQQGSNLCIGLDPHFEPNGQLNEAFYLRYAGACDLQPRFVALAHYLQEMGFARFSDPSRAGIFVAGVASYNLKLVDAHWSAGIRVFKPQSSFYEVLSPFGPIVMRLICQRIDALAARDNAVAFKADDAKRGDIDSTQARYYAAYLPGEDFLVFPGAGGQFDFDTMTVTTWMGRDVLTPGLVYFKRGKGAIVVTRTSNPSGTTMQDLLIEANEQVALSDKQLPFKAAEDALAVVEHLLRRRPSAWEFMLYETEAFCRGHDLISDDVSPVFSVIGATVKMDKAFRQLRPSGTALVPGFGRQQGAFANVMDLVATDGPLAGHGVMWSSSSYHNFPWQAKFGGDDDCAPDKLHGHVTRSVDEFRATEQQAYQQAHLSYPF